MSLDRKVLHEQLQIAKKLDPLFQRLIDLQPDEHVRLNTMRFACAARHAQKQWLQHYLKGRFPMDLNLALNITYEDARRWLIEESRAGRIPERENLELSKTYWADQVESSFGSRLPSFSALRDKNLTEFITQLPVQYRVSPWEFSISEDRDQGMTTVMFGPQGDVFYSDSVRVMFQRYHPFAVMENELLWDTVEDCPFEIPDWYGSTALPAKPNPFRAINDFVGLYDKAISLQNNQ